MGRLAISVTEFRQMLRSSCPPTGWGNLLAVAHSGGSDSTCLLYLLHQLVLEQWYAKDGPRKLLALSVDHSLQLGSVAMAEHCRKFSESLQISHATLSIPWGCSPFPDRPASHRPYETVARAARYRVLMEAMKANSATVIAMGHHADDHVETLLMRLARDVSGSVAPTGMRKCRRWGMGTKPNGLDWVGFAGMQRWIIRPFLGVPKERILATCALHGLNYVNDPTNFQPSLTPRNYVRRYLSQNMHPSSGQDDAGGLGDLPLVKNLDNAVRRLDTIATHVSGSGKGIPKLERLYAAASQLTQLCDNNDKKVDQYLRDFTRASPSSTLLLSLPPHDSWPPPEIRRGIVLRVLRFISPRSWGSPLSEASRRSSSLDLIGDRLWNSSLDHRGSFSAGSEVIWRPVYVRDDGRIRLTSDQRNLRDFGWLASRQSPIKRNGRPSPCVQDISALLATKDAQELLWDNRFMLKLQPYLLPSDILESCSSPGSVMVLPHGRWLLPKIVWRRECNDLILGGVDLQDELQLLTLNSKWVDVKFIRCLDAI